MNIKKEVIICDKGYEIFGVQPILLNEKELTLFRNKKRGEHQRLPSWYQRVNQYIRNHFYIFDRILCDELEYVDQKGEVKAVYKIEVFVGENISLNQAVIVYELRHLEGDHQHYSLNEFRDWFVLKEPNESCTNEHVIAKKLQEIRKQSMTFIQSTLGLTSATIESNTCNLTMFYTSFNPSTSFIDDVERVKSERNEIIISPRTTLYFGGRFHLVEGNDNDENDLMKAMLFKLQLTWFYVPKYSKVAMTYFQQSLAEKSALYTSHKEASTFIKIYRVVKIQNELSKLALEAFQSAYEICEQRWRVEKNILALGEFSEYFMAQSETEHRKAQERKSNILNYVLGILAFIGLASFPADFLTTLYYSGEYSSWNAFLHSIITPELAWINWFVLCILGIALVLLITVSITSIKHRR